MLVDSGSTNNFISPAGVKNLGLTIIRCSPISVSVANGAQLSCTQRVNKVNLEIDGLTFYVDMRVLPIGGYDIILGVEWMKIVSPVVFDFEDNHISVWWQGKRTELNQKVKVPKVKVVTRNREVNKGDTCYLIRVMVVNKIESKAKMPEVVKGILEEFSDVFEEPKGLPPIRSQDHKILLQVGRAPVNCNPYKCPYVHKKKSRR
ncbi:uncharacterized protein LOC141679516 [Apium graveolens]|uniref:uncharacterized protein LOC141679516 n=1 Tax=Apium graveolens TaxID=4045 RepID=UPI003D7C107C